MGETKENILYYGDNLDILRRYIESESVDLIYLDPPFKSNQDYHVLFAEKNGPKSQGREADARETSFAERINPCKDKQ